MPGEENPTAVTEAEAEATAGPEEDTKLEDLVTEGEVGVPAEQEAEKPEPEQEQETEPSFDEALETAKGQIEGLRESDPEQLEKLSQLFGGDELTARQAAVELREAELLAAAGGQAASKEVEDGYSSQRNDYRTKVAQYSQAIGTMAVNAARETGEAPKISATSTWTALDKEMTTAEGIGKGIGFAESFLVAKNASLSSVVGAKFTAEEVAGINSLTWQDAVSNPQETYGKLFATVLKAAVRAAPEEAVKQGVSKAKATKEAAEVLENLTKTLPKNGKARIASTSSASKTYSEMTSDERSKLTPEQRDALASASVKE